jgi:hypothetical protein
MKSETGCAAYQTKEHKEVQSPVSKSSPKKSVNLFSQLIIPKLKH